MIYLSRLDLPCNGLRASSCLISIAKYLRNYPDSFPLFREISPFDDPRLSLVDWSSLSDVSFSGGLLTLKFR